MSVTRHEVILWAESGVIVRRAWIADFDQMIAKLAEHETESLARWRERKALAVRDLACFEFIVRALRDPEPDPEEPAKATDSLMACLVLHAHEIALPVDELHGIVNRRIAELRVSLGEQIDARRKESRP